DGSAATSASNCSRARSVVVALCSLIGDSFRAAIIGVRRHNAPVRWDVFCRVVDNLGDAGVCWRLCADLAARGESVRLLIDDMETLRRIAPDGAAGVSVQPWRDNAPFDAVTDVVIEAFGCNPPAGYVAAMAHAARPPVGIN